LKSWQASSTCNEAVESLATGLSVSR